MTRRRKGEHELYERSWLIPHIQPIIAARIISILLPFVRFEVFTAVTMKNGVFLDVTPCGSCKNRRFGGTQRLVHQGDKDR
jgi:hypothetical protein